MELKRLSAILMMAAFMIRCGNDSLEKPLCEQEGGAEIVGQIGKIYKSPNSQNHFFIGTTTPPASGVNGGYIPCMDLPTEFQIEGLTIKYSGRERGAIPDTGDPLFVFITLTSIEK